MSDTIAAIATGGGVAAVGVLRVSGGGAVAAAGAMFRAAGGVALAEAESRHMYYGEIVGADGGVLDLCLCCVFRAPDSYTGEDVVEFHCHGSPIVLGEVMRELLARGVRQAEAGEFTKRAFLNGRMDLTQAEAVIDLIQAETPAAARNAAGQIKGAIAVRLEAIYSDLLNIMAHFHAAIDYPDEDIDEFEMQVYIYMLQDARDELRWMLSTHKRGRVLREGIPTVIVGRPNTGKSSLLNALAGYSRVIVTDVPGTTRDTVEEKIVVGNIQLRLTDTAGIRKTEDGIEKLGVERTLAALRDARLAILVLDGSEPLQGEDIQALRSMPPDIPRIIAVNKSDLPPALRTGELQAFELPYCRISALTGAGLDSLEERIIKAFPDQSIPPDGELISNARQAQAIVRAYDAIIRAIDAIKASVTPDAVLADVEAALSAIGETTGKTIREDIVSRIFERFCVGK